MQGSDYNPYQAPSSDIAAEPGEQPDGELRLATRGSRLLAVLVDGLIQCALVLPIQFAFGFFDGFPRMATSAFKTVEWTAFGLLVFLGLNGFLLLKNGQTIGKRAIGIRIANNSDAGVPPLAKIFLLRVLPIQLVASIPFVGGVIAVVDMLMIFRADCRCFHDHLAGTIVLKV